MKSSKKTAKKTKAVGKDKKPLHSKALKQTQGGFLAPVAPAQTITPIIMPEFHLGISETPAKPVVPPDHLSL